MKNTLKTLTLAVLLIALCVSPSLAQSIGAPTSTTTAAAINPGTDNTIVTVASTTGMTASTNSVQTFILINRELMRVRTVQSSTVLIVARAIDGPAVGHASGARVTYGPGGGTWSTGTSGVASGSNAVFLTSGVKPTGSCTRANNQYLPLISVSNPSATYDCDGGVWVQGNLPNDPTNPITLVGQCTVPIGSVAYGSMGTDTTTSATAELTASIFVPMTFWSTGATNLNGSAVNTGSKKVFVLRDNSGIAIANTALAGTAATGNDAFQAIAWTAPRLVVGPARYFVAIQDDTADVAGVRTIAAATFNNVVTVSNTSVFGTVPLETMPSTFTADVGPIMCLY